MNHFFTCAFSVLVGLTFAGCTLAPDYEQPNTSIGNNWSVSVPIEKGAYSEQQPEWNHYFLDSTLQSLIKESLESNKDLRIAILNVEKARAQYGIQRSDRIPTISADGAHTSARIAEDLSTRGSSYVGRQYTVNAGIIGYELDLFGRVKSLSDAALETFLATDEAAKSARISLIAQVASSYFTYIADRELLGIAEATLASQKSTYDMMQRRHSVGITSTIDVLRAETTVDTAQSDVARYKSQTIEDLNALSVLIGRPVSKDEIPATKLADLQAFPELPIGLPSEVLLNRPDIQQMEHQLRAAYANIGAARANFFPSISLTAALGRGSVELSDLFDGGNKTWSFSPSIYLPIFDMGRNQARLDVAKANQKIAVENYDKTVQMAFREVSDALERRVRLEERLQSQIALTNATSRAYQLSDERYKRGMDSFLGVLDAQRSMYSAQQMQVSTNLLRNINLIELYKVLGGGLK